MSEAWFLVNLMITFAIIAFKIIVETVCFLFFIFLNYIEWVDAVLLGLIAYAFAIAQKWPNDISAGIGVAIGFSFLVVFHLTTLLRRIATGVFSLLWADVIASSIKAWFNAGTVTYWTIVACSFVFCVYLHIYARNRAGVKEEIRQEIIMANTPLMGDSVEKRQPKTPVP